jgi:hypothetical protein
VQVDSFDIVPLVLGFMGVVQMHVMADLRRRCSKVRLSLAIGSCSKDV